MRVVLVTSTFLPNFVGGREKHVYGLAKALIRAGVDAYVVSGDRVNRTKFEEYNGIPVYRVPFIKELGFRGTHETIPYRVVSLNNLFSVLDRIDPDLIHAHDIKHFTSDAAALYAVLRRKPYVLTVHGIYYRFSRITKLLYMLHDVTVNMFTLAIAKKIIVVSKSLVKFPITAFAEKVVYIPNAVEVPRADCINDFRDRYGIPKDCRIVVSIGRITRQKGFDVLIRAWIAASRSFPDECTKLVIIGSVQSQDYFEYLQKLAGSRNDIVFLCGIPEADVYAAMREAAVVVIASRDEGLPTVLLEALVLGKPVVATSVGAIPWIVRNGVTGLLVKPEDPEGLAEALRRMLTDDKLRVEIASRAAKLGRVFSWNNIVKHVIGVYEEAIRR